MPYLNLFIFVNGFIVCDLIFYHHIGEIVVRSIFSSPAPPAHFFGWVEQCRHSQDSFVIHNGPFSLWPVPPSPSPSFFGWVGRNNTVIIILFVIHNDSCPPFRFYTPPLLGGPLLAPRKLRPRGNCSALLRNPAETAPPFWRFGFEPITFKMTVRVWT